MTRTSSLVRAAAASVAVVFVMSGCTSPDDEPAVAQPTQDVTTTDDGGDEEEDYYGGGDLPTTEPGTFTYDNGPFPVTFTTTVPTVDPSQEVTPTGFFSVTPTAYSASTFRSASLTCPNP